MRIAIPTNDKIRLTAHAGRATGFMIFDIDGKQAREVEYREHTPRHQHGDHAHDSGHHHHGGHGTHSHRGLLDLVSDCSLVVASGMGPRLVADFEAHGIGVRFTRERDVREIAGALAAGTFENDARGSSCHHCHETPVINEPER